MEFLFRDCYNVCKVYFIDYLVKILEYSVYIVILFIKIFFIDFLYV